MYSVVESCLLCGMQAFVCASRADFLRGSLVTDNANKSIQIFN